MSRYIVHDGSGKILRTGRCPESMVDAQARAGEFVLRGRANDITEKVEGQGRFRWVMKKTPEEILRDNPPPPVIPDEDRPAQMTKKELALLMQRVKDIEDRATGNP